MIAVRCPAGAAHGWLLSVELGSAGFCDRHSIDTAHAHQCSPASMWNIVSDIIIHCLPGSLSSCIAPAKWPRGRTTPGVGEDLNGQEMCPRVSIPHAHPTNPTLITGMPSPLALVSVLCVHFLGKGLKKVRTWGCGAWTPGMFQFCIPSNL